MPDKPKPKAPLTSKLTNKVVLNNDPTMIGKDVNPAVYNQFQSFLAKKNLVNDPRMNTVEGKKALTDELINEYNSSEYIKKYPNNIITPQAINAVQQYHKLTDPNVVVDGWVGSQTSQMRYPSYTTTAEMKSLDPNNPNYNVPIKDTIDVSYGNKNYKLASNKFNKGAMRKEDFIDPATNSLPYAAHKKGGLVEKLKGYAGGGSTGYNEFNPNANSLTDQYGNPIQDTTYTNTSPKKLDSNLVNGGIGGVAALSEMGGAYIDSTNEPDDLGKVDVRKATASGALKGAGKGAGIGAGIGSIVPGVGTVAGAAVGAGIGGAIGGFNANKKAKSGNELIDDQIDADKQDLFNQNAQNAIAKRNSQNYANGGKIEGKGTAKSDSIIAKVKQDSFVVPAENAEKAEIIRKVILKAPVKKANLNQVGGEKVRLSNGEHVFSPLEVLEIKNKGIDLDDLAPDAYSNGSLDPNDLSQDKMKKGGLVGYANGNYVKNGDPYKPTKEEQAYLASLYKKPAPKYYSKSEAKKQTTQDKLAADYLQSKMPALIQPQNNSYMGVDIPKEELYAGRTPEETMAYNATTTTTPNITSVENKGMNLGDIGSGLINYGLPLAQAGLGAYFLNKQGKRPVGQLDSDYLKAIEGTRANVDLANANAKFGFTPEEQALLNNQNATLTNTGRFNARNLSGGSAANAYNMERGVINDSYGRGLQAAIQNRNLILQKQGIAADKQSQLNDMIASKANMSRTLFNDKLNAFQQNQNAGSSLLSAGLSNLIGAKQYQDALKASQNTENIRNSYLNYLPK